MKHSIRSLIAVVAVLAVAGLAFAHQGILDDPSRSDEERARDAGTKPLELYAFFDIGEGTVVGDMMPGSGYHTAILSKLVGDSGKVYSGPDRNDRMMQRLEANPMANVELISGFGELPAGGLDVIITVRNVHDLMLRDNEGPALEAWMTALKPGGILGIVDARTRSHEGADNDSHRVNEDAVIAAATAAGFELVESSDLLANPDDDDSSYAEGVERYQVDRLTLKFRKPGM